MLVKSVAGQDTLKPKVENSSIPITWGAGQGRQQRLTWVTANADAVLSGTRLVELDVLIWSEPLANIGGLAEDVRLPSDSNVVTVFPGGYYSLGLLRTCGEDPATISELIP